jgi:hypothetical protein
MTKVHSTLKGLSLLVFMLALASLAHAQATRTWVSGVGDDVNPCSRTAPCKTFAGAISKTFINGEIDMLDPGGYGTLTITKSITVDGGTGQGWGSVLASGTNGVTVSLTDTSGNDPQKTVRLRHLSINGTGASGTVGTRTGINGITVSSLSQAGTTVIVDSCLIDGFSSNGINATFNAGGNLVVENSDIQECGVTGIKLSTASGFVAGTINNSRIERNGIGVNIGTNTFASVEGSNVSINTGDGVKTISNGTVNVQHTLLGYNGGSAVNASVSGSTIRVSSNQIINNTSSITIAAGATVASDADNRLSGNTGGVAPNGVITKQ